MNLAAQLLSVKNYFLDNGYIVWNQEKNPSKIFPLKITYFHEGESSTKKNIG